MRRQFVSACGAVLAGLLASAGCQAPPQPAGPTMERVAAETPADRDILLEVVCDVLRDCAFRLDRQDRVNGVVTTFPETSAQAFELWRPQPRPAYYWWEANLHTLQRQVTVEFPPGDRPNETRLVVKVDRLRYRLEERQIDNTAGAMRLFSSEAPTATGRRARPGQTACWIPEGRDEHMEHWLLGAILRRYDERTGGLGSQPVASATSLGPASPQ